VTSGIIVCYSTCWSCKFGHHNLEPHVWWDEDDVWEEHPEYTKPLPEGQCACNCAVAIEYEKEMEDEAVESYEHGELPDESV
jgi:hypothetical protein